MKKIAFLSLFCIILNAHSLHIFIEDKNDKFINLKSYFRGNSPCKKCEVSVILNEKIIEKIKTDENGKVKIKIPNGNFEIKVNGGLGHEAKIKIENLQKNSNLQNSGKLQILENEIFKFIISFLIIFIFFGIIYKFKKR